MKLTARSDFDKLVGNIVKLFEGVRRNLAVAYWTTGRWIVESEQAGKARSQHGKGLLKDLSARLTREMGSGFSITNLTDMRLFYLANRNSRPAVNLPMSYQIELLRVQDSGARQALEKKAEREGLSRNDLRALIRAEKGRMGGGKRSVDRTPLVPKRGIPGTYRVKSAEEIGWPVPGMFLLDNGFRSYKELTPLESRGPNTNQSKRSGDWGRPNYHYGKEMKSLGGLKAGNIVELVGGKLRKSGRTEKDLYTYPAYFTKGIDGDSFWMTLDRGRGDVALQKLRLRGIDCPEINTPEGQAAKKFVESALKAAISITVCSSKNDHYDRYEADVFFLPARSLKASAGGTCATGHKCNDDKAGKQVYLNNLLLERGYAVRVHG